MVLSEKWTSYYGVLTISLYRQEAHYPCDPHARETGSYAPCFVCPASLTLGNSRTLPRDPTGAVT